MCSGTDNCEQNCLSPNLLSGFPPFWLGEVETKQNKNQKSFTRVTNTISTKKF